MRFRYRTAIFFVTISIGIAGLFLPALAAYPAAGSPFVAVTNLLVSRTLPMGALLLVSFMSLICLLRRRALCRSLCPIGFCFDLIRKIRRQVTGANKLSGYFRSFPKFGLYLAIFTWLGSLFGVIGFLWLDPFVLFASLFRWSEPLVFVLLFLFILAWFAPGLWCRSFCPLGGVQDILSAPKSLKFKSSESPLSRPGDEMRHRLLRRGFIFAGFAVLFGQLFRHRNRLSCQSNLRPPGALAEPWFSALCTRCGACVQTCPTRLLKAVRFEESPLLCGTPKVDFNAAWCESDCIACSQSCPSAAIGPISVQEKPSVKIGRAIFAFEYCRLYDDIECSVCQRECPYGAIHYEWSEEEYRRMVKIDEQKCTGCGRCLFVCPVAREPDREEPFPLSIVRANKPSI